MNRISVLVAASALGAVALTAGCSSSSAKSAGAGGGGLTPGSASSVGGGASSGGGTSSSGSGSGTDHGAGIAPTSAASSGSSGSSGPSGSSGGGTSSSAPPTHAGGACTTAEMPSGTWRLVPDSQGAGHVAADIALQNTSGHSCTVAGFPGIALLASNDRTLPSYVVKDDSVAVTTIKVAPGAFVHVEMRYSANVPGPGEPETGQCEPTTVHAQAQLPGDAGWAHITLDNPTPVCEKGELQMKPFVGGKASPDGG